MRYGEYEGGRHGSQTGGGRKAVISVDAHSLRAQAQRCWEMLRLAVKPEVKEQLREWAKDFEAAAAAKEKKKS